METVWPRTGPEFAARGRRCGPQRPLNEKDGTAMRILFSALFLTPLMALATPALAGATFAAPEGCTTFMTVQAKACRVSNHYTCAADAPGDQWRADFDQEGVFFLTRHATQADAYQQLGAFVGEGEHVRERTHRYLAYAVARQASLGVIEQHTAGIPAIA